MKVKFVNKLKSKFGKEPAYFISNTLFMNVIFIIVTIENFFLIWFFANFFSREMYGFYSFGLAILSIISVITLPGLSTALNREVALGHENYIRPFWKVSIRFGFIGSILCLFAILAINTENIELTLFFTTLLILFPIIGSGSLYFGFLAGKLEFKTQGILFLFSKSIAIIFTLFTLFLTNNALMSLLVTIIVEYTLNALICLKIANKYSSPRKSLDLTNSIDYGKKLTLLSIPSIIATISLDKIILGTFLGLGEIAQYVILITFPEQIKALLKPLNDLAFPKIVVESTTTIRKKLYYLFLMLLILVSVIIVTYIIFAQFIFSLIFPKFMDVVFFSQLFMISMITFPSFIFSIYFEAKQLIRQLYIYRISNLLLTLSLSIILVLNFGLFGAVMARIISRFISALILLILFHLSSLNSEV